MTTSVRPAGPVDVAVIALPDDRVDTGILSAVNEIVAQGTVRILDVVLVSKSEDGDVRVVEIEDERLGVDLPDLLSDEDALAAAEGLPEDTSVVLLAWENVWAARAAQAIRDAGGQVLVQERIPAADVSDALDALDRLDDSPKES